MCFQGVCGISSIIMLSVNFFSNISSYDILAYITKNYIALIYYASFTRGRLDFQLSVKLVHVQGGGSNLSIYHSRLLFMLLCFNTCYCC